MKWLKVYSKFESMTNNSDRRNFWNMIEDLKDTLLFFSDNGCQSKLFPQDDIGLNIIRLKGKSHLQSITIPFYVEIDIDRVIISIDKNRSGFGPLPDWFIENCRRIEDLMKSFGYKTQPSIRYAVDWEHFDSIDELSEQQSLIYKVRLEFKNRY